MPRSAKRKPNEEVFRDGDTSHVLTSDFGFLVSINSFGKDVSLIFADLSVGLLPPVDIRNVISSALKGNDCNDHKVAEYLIEKYGIQECAIIARLMLSHAMIGDEKKSQIANGEEMSQTISMMIPTQLKNLKKLGLFLAATSATSTVLVCLIFSLFGLHI